MSRQILSLETLTDWSNGKASVAFEVALAACVRDIVDRPGEKAARKVVLTASLVPVLQQDGDVTDASIDFTIVTKLPAHHVAAGPAGVTRQGGLFFQSDSPDNPHQTTCLDAGGEEDDE